MYFLVHFLGLLFTLWTSTIPASWRALSKVSYKRLCFFFPPQIPSLLHESHRLYLVPWTIKIFCFLICERVISYLKYLASPAGLFIYLSIFVLKTSTHCYHLSINMLFFLCLFFWFSFSFKFSLNLQVPICMPILTQVTCALSFL